VEGELPAVVAVDPEGGTVGDLGWSDGSVGGEDDGVGERCDEVVEDGCVAGLAVEHEFDDLRAFEDTASGAELAILVGEEGEQDGAVGLALGVEEALFERVEVVLELSGGHGSCLSYRRMRVQGVSVETSGC
jgi:hypothetical protein